MKKLGWELGFVKYWIIGCG